MFKLKNDKYRQARGGYARFLTISCKACSRPLCLYQKDGPGPLKRTYLDRFVAPTKLVELQKHTNPPAYLKCQNCGKTIGKLYLYDKEPRLAYRMSDGEFTKKVTKGIFGP